MIKPVDIGCQGFRLDLVRGIHRRCLISHHCNDTNCSVLRFQCMRRSAEYTRRASWSQLDLGPRAHPLVVLEQLQAGQHDVVHVAEA